MVKKAQVFTRVSTDQKEMRSAFLGGFAGQLVSGMIWLASAAISVIITPNLGMAVLFFGCMGIFPLTVCFTGSRIDFWRSLLRALRPSNI